VSSSQLDEDEEPDVPSSNGSKIFLVANCSLKEDSSDPSSLSSVCAPANEESESELSSSDSSLSTNCPLSTSTGKDPSTSTGKDLVVTRLPYCVFPSVLESVLLSDMGKIRSSSKSRFRLNDGGSDGLAEKTEVALRSAAVPGTRCGDV
jgi:hypothetical protein